MWFQNELFSLAEVSLYFNFKKNLLPTDEETTRNKLQRADDISHNTSMKNFFADFKP